MTLEDGQTWKLKNSAGETAATYNSSEDKGITIHSEAFGFIAHQNDNSIILEKGTVLNSLYTTFLVRSRSSNETLTATIDDAKNTNGVVLTQVVDNDDATNSGMINADDELK